MKRLYLIGGPMGVGKSTLGQYLKRRLDAAVLLDGDWCWDADPFIVNNETKAMVMDNICFLLNSFLRSSVYQNIIFCWVLDQQSTIDQLLNRLDTADCSVRVISLLADEETLKNRIVSDVRSGVRSMDVLQRSLDRLGNYQAIRSQKVYTDNKSPEEVAAEILTHFPDFTPL